MLLVIVALGALAVAGCMALMPGEATVTHFYLWPAEATPSTFGTVLQQSGWTPAPDRQYYFVGYNVRFRSLLPIGLNRLHGEVRNLPAGVRAQLYQQFPRRTGRFEQIELDVDFLIEMPPDQSPEQVARSLEVEILSGTWRWPRIPLRIAPKVEMIRTPAYER